MIVLVRPAHDADVLAHSEQVEVGRRDVDASDDQRVVIARVVGLERPGAVEDPRQVARREGGHVQHDEHGRGEVGRERGGEPGERLDASRRRTDG